MAERRAQAGYTIVELLVAMLLFSLISVGFYQVLFASTRASQVARGAVRQSEEVRLGFNRMVRDTREASELRGATDTTFPTATSFRIEVDFNADGTIEPFPLDPAGNYEKLIFTFNPGAGTITASNESITEVLMADVDCIRKADNTCHDIFSYSSSRLEFDANGDGVATAAELDTSIIGNNNGIIDGDELGLVDTVTFSLRVTKNDRTTNFYAEAQMRNQR